MFIVWLECVPQFMREVSFLCGLLLLLPLSRSFSLLFLPLSSDSSALKSLNALKLKLMSYERGQISSDKEIAKVILTLIITMIEKLKML